ncbi:MAG: heavy metal translocating P-type ATPase [Thermoplasmata archaeon]|nr:heavy metal translocating P-type ATPase [Thermoplasmata archaeon]
MATDPICGMFVEEGPDALQLVRGNRTYFFCSTVCLRQFAEPQEELRRLRRKLAVAWPLALVVVALTYVVQPSGAVWISFALAGVVEFYPGWQFFAGTRGALRSRGWNMDVLIAVGTGMAFGYSVLVLVLPGHLPTAYYFDASALIVTLILTGNYLEHLTRESARASLSRLQEVLPATALLVRAGVEREIPLSDLTEGDHVRVRPGGRIPVDGTVVEGTSTANESLLTGESLPAEKRPGNRVIAGSINGEGRLEILTVRVGPDTLLSQVGQLVADAETSRVPLQELANRIAAGFVPFVLAVALAATLAWAALGVGPAVSVLVFVSVVITACPCAFAIATPAAIVVGTGRAAEEGIVFKGKDSLERASRIDLVLTDKTGTLTLGRPVLTDAIPLGTESAKELLGWSAAAERGSEHPLARAVVDAARTRGLPLGDATDVQTLPGVGVRGLVNRVEIAVRHGRDSSVGDSDRDRLAPITKELEARGKAWSIVTRNGAPVGVLAFFDEVRPGTSRAVRALAADGIPVVLVTGDHAAAAQAVARQLGIGEVHSEMTPASKLALIRKYQQEGRKVAFVGDGINDAPALAAADLGIAVGGATAVAQETSGVILLRSDFGGVALALRLGRRTVRKVRGNLTWAIGYNAVLLPVAVGALVPWFGLGIFTILPITGAIAMALSSTSVVLNSLSLRWVRLGPRHEDGDPFGGPRPTPTGA